MRQTWATGGMRAFKPSKEWAGCERHLYGAAVGHDAEIMKAKTVDSRRKSNEAQGIRLR